MSLAENLSPNPRERLGHNNPPEATRAETMHTRYADMLADVVTVEVHASKLPKKVENDIELGRLGEVVTRASKLSKKIDETRKTEVEPHLTAQRELNGFFNAFIDRLKGVGKILEQRATEYQREKAAAERRRLEEAARKAREEEERQRQIAEAAAAKGRAGTALKHEDRAEEAGERAARAEIASQVSAADLTRVRSETGVVATSRTSWSFAIEDASKIPLETLRPYLPRAEIEKAIRSFVRMGGRELPGVRIFEDTKASFR